MDIANLTGITSDYLNTFAKRNSLVETDDETFSSVLESMMSSLEETNTLQNRAEAEEIRFAMGEAENTHDLLIAASKANIALQYTVAVRDRLIEGYNQIMQMQV
ncbi:MAG: flagellar hook-basal body complex protein FliE [Muribaculaceae bacterium]|nr:flagellar hook-basal body complex protein FliE [Roseburia sp.]MCM1431080.1 flagellar hook-basal body complex protein FliE [Muribaculaceae bacterium]MCM1493340.1 flagellar hook-basal body complex protein FliE [Muribaculaceae bacterium]